MIVHVAVTKPQPWHIVRQVVHVSTTRCARPVRVTAGHGNNVRRVWIDCARRLPSDQRCRPCTTHLITEPVITGDSSARVFPEGGPATR